MSPGRGLRAWARSLSPSWQLVAPGLLAWFATVATQATRESRLSLGFALLSLLSLLSGPWLTRVMAELRARMLAFWGFVLGAALSLLAGGSARELSGLEALTMALSWGLFAWTAAAPALPPSDARLIGAEQPQRSKPARARLWIDFLVLCICLLWCALALASLEGARNERITSWVLAATVWSLAALEVLASWTRRRVAWRLRPGWLLLACLSTTLTLAGFLGWLRAPLQSLGVSP